MEYGLLLAFFVSVFAIIGSVVGSYFASRFQLRSGSVIERSRFRHDIGQLTAKHRLDRHLELLTRANDATREAANSASPKAKASAKAEDMYNDFRNFFYDNSLFWSEELKSALMTRKGDGLMNGGLIYRLRRFVMSSSSNQVELNEWKNIAFSDLRSVTAQVREDLLIDDLDRSVRRAVQRWHVGHGE